MVIDGEWGIGLTYSRVIGHFEPTVLFDASVEVRVSEC